MTYHIDKNSSKDGARDGLAINGIINTPNKLLVARTVEAGNDAKNYNGKEGDDSADNVKVSYIGASSTNKRTLPNHIWVPG